MALGIAVGEAGVVHPHRHRNVLQFAVAVGDAEGADVVAFGEEQLHGHAAIALQLLGVGADRHPLRRFGGTGGQQAAAGLRGHQAEAAGAHRRQPLEMAEGGQLHAGGAGGLQQAGAGGHRHLLAVHPQGDNTHGAYPRVSPSGPTVHTSGGSQWDGSRRAASYSWRNQRRVLSTGFGAA